MDNLSWLSCRAISQSGQSKIEWINPPIPPTPTCLCADVPGGRMGAPWRQAAHLQEVCFEVLLPGFQGQRMHAYQRPPAVSLLLLGRSVQRPSSQHGVGPLVFCLHVQSHPVCSDRSDRPNPSLCGQFCQCTNSSFCIRFLCSLGVRCYFTIAPIRGHLPSVDILFSVLNLIFASFNCLSDERTLFINGHFFQYIDLSFYLLRVNGLIAVCGEFFNIQTVILISLIWLSLRWENVHHMWTFH